MQIEVILICKEVVENMTLGDLSKNQKAKIIALPSNFELAEQLLEQGFVPQSVISLAHKAPWNGPMAFRLHNTKITLQQDLASQVIVDAI